MIEVRNACTVFGGIHEKNTSVGNLGADGSEILKRNLKKLGMSV
jgi:hypothetical protein